MNKTELGRKIKQKFDRSYYEIKKGSYKKVTWDYFSEKYGYSKSTLKNVFSGDAKLETMIEIAKLLEINVNLNIEK